ncbi:MAG: M20 family metallopeptidase [Promethearchaeota archaeon]
MHGSEKIILDKIEEMREDIIEFHRRIVQMPSENPPGRYKEISHFIKNKMDEIGLNTKSKMNNVIGEVGGNDGPTLIFNAHYDTIEKFTGWMKKPFEANIENNRIYGRGASDDKSCIAAEIFAAKALIDSGLDFKGKLIITAVNDEELGGLGGSSYLLKRNIIKGDACIVGDAPADFPVGYLHGAIFISVVIRGKQSHGFLLPDLPSPNRNQYSGISAIHKMVPIMIFLLDLQDEFAKIETKYPVSTEFPSRISSVNLAMIEGGTKISTVADHCYLHCSIQTIPELDIEEIKKRILKYIEKLKHEDPDLDITVQIPIFYGSHIINTESRFAKAVKGATKSVYGEEREFKFSNCTTDAHWFAEMGIETVMIGTFRKDNFIHCADENVNIDDLINVTKMFALTALNYLRETT